MLLHERRYVEAVSCKVGDGKRDREGEVESEILDKRKRERRGEERMRSLEEGKKEGRKKERRKEGGRAKK